MCGQGSSVQAGLCPGLSCRPPPPSHRDKHCIPPNSILLQKMHHPACGAGGGRERGGSCSPLTCRAQPVSLWDHTWVSCGAPGAPSAGASPPAAGGVPDGAASRCLCPVQVPRICFPHPARRHRRVFHTRSWVVHSQFLPSRRAGAGRSGTVQPFLGLGKPKGALARAPASSVCF